MKRGPKQFTHRYRWLSQVPLRDGKDALKVNWFEIEIRGPAGELTYRNSLVTDLPVNRETVAELAACGRTRWKIENETFNVLKTQGYHLEHSYGHGKQNLAALLVTFNLLAFAFHTVCDQAEHLWRLARTKAGSRAQFFGRLAAIASFDLSLMGRPPADTGLRQAATPAALITASPHSTRHPPPANPWMINTNVKMRIAAQHMLACPAKRGQAVRSLQFRQHRGKHRMQQRRRDWVQHIADMVVARNPSQSEQALAVRPSVALPQLTLMRQEGRDLHKEHRERGHPDIGDRIDRVHPPALVGERLAALAQAAEKGLEVFHPLVESYPAPVSEPSI
jgi:hypothetical protein